MKSVFSWFLIVALLSCNNSKPVPEMPGAYLMTSQTLTKDGKDTKFTALKQLKIYADSFFMYTQVNPDDSVSAFGVGSYSSSPGGITEKVIYSASDTIVGAQATYPLEIDKFHEGYKQFIPEIRVQGEVGQLREEYKEVGEEANSPLDGVWKEVKSFDIGRNDTTPKNRTQYKAYFDGYFMFGHTVRDSADRTTTGIGFGTFEMNGDKQIKETDLNSTYAIIAGNTFVVDIAMDGPDKYMQTITDSLGNRSIEYYERLK